MPGIDVSAVSSVVGVQTRYVDLSGGKAKYLPQRLAVFAQGATAVSYPTSKWTALSANATGNRFGFGSPAHLIMRELKPEFGGGVGTIPVDIFPLVDAGGSAAAEGKVVPSGTGTVAAERRLRIGGYLSNAFVIGTTALTGVALTAACAAIGDAVSAVLHMPVNVTYTYGTVTAAAGTNTGNGTCTSLSVLGGGAPRPGAWTLKCVTAVANGGVFSLTDPKGVVVNAALTMTVGAGAATVFNTGTGGLQFTLTDGSTDFAVNDSFTVTVPATEVKFPSKWKGASANGIVIELVEETFVGVSFAITQPTGGLVNPDLTATLASVGSVIWYSMGLNALNLSDTTALDAIKTWGEPRWLPVTSKPCVVFTGTTTADMTAATAISAVRKDDRVNAQLVAPGSSSLPFVVAAAQLAPIAATANNNPPTGYKANQIPSIRPGNDNQQWDYNTREIALKDNGSSTVEVIDGVVQIGDVVTFWHPTGELPPGFNYVVNIVKLQQVIFNLRLEFEKKEWAAAPLLTDNDVTVNPNARRPKDAKAKANAIIKNLGLEAILTNVKEALKKTTVTIDSQNPNRLNIQIIVQLSGNTNVKDITLDFGFFFGQALAA